MAHRSDIVRRSPTLQCLRRITRPGLLPGSSLVSFAIVITLFLVFIILFLPTCLRLIDELKHPPHGLTKQDAQFNSFDAAIELFNSEFDGYPPSGALDENGKPYCGAMKLCEAMMGQDLQGFHPNSKFNADGLDESGALLYGPNTLDIRKGPYLPEANGNPYRLKNLYENVGPFDANDYVLCDELKQVRHTGTGMRIGMPVLYYKADTSKTAHDVNDPDNPENIYDYRDNQALLALGVPGKPGRKHPLYENPKIFYEITINNRVAGPKRLYRADTYILLSAGRDGLYGSEDDIANFQIRLKPK